MFHKNKYFPKLTFFKLSKIIILILLSNQILLAQENWSKNKKAIINSIDEHKGRLIEISDQIWAAAETSLEEFKSSKYLSALSNVFDGTPFCILSSISSTITPLRAFTSRRYFQHLHHFCTLSNNLIPNAFIW